MFNHMETLSLYRKIRHYVCMFSCQNTLFIGMMNRWTTVPDSEEEFRHWCETWAHELEHDKHETVSWVSCLVITDNITFLMMSKPVTWMLKFQVHTNNFNSRLLLCFLKKRRFPLPCSKALNPQMLHTGQKYCQFTSVSWKMVESN